MGHHINKDGKFQSDKYPDLTPDKVVLSFKDPTARKALRVYAENAEDKEFGDDILKRIKSIEE